jgi:preprotein translocase subunit YajC
MSFSGPVELSLMAQGQPSALTAFLPLVLIMGIFYVLLILPAQRRQKKAQEMLANLKTGDKIVTTGGLYGTIVGLEQDSVQLRIADQVRVKVARSAIAGHQPESSKES